MKNGFHPFATYLPCEDLRNHSFPRPWAEEPPLFHFFAASLYSLGIVNPAIANLILGFIVMVLLFSFLTLDAKHTKKEKLLAWGFIAGTPVFLRYQAPHLPEILSIAFLLVGVNLYWRTQRIIGTVLFFTLAVTTKAYSFFPVSTLLFWMLVWRGRKEKNLFWTSFLFVLSLVFVAFPFFFWVWILWFKGIPNPFNFAHFFTNRHSGSWGTLFTNEYWDRFFTYQGTKGVGWVLYLAYLVFVINWIKKKKFSSEFEEFVFFWMLSLFIFWLFVRNASIVHDHYVLQYFIPLAYLGVRSLLKIKQKFFLYILFAISLCSGLSNPITWFWVAKSKGPAEFCSQENHSLFLFPLKN